MRAAAGGGDAPHAPKSRRFARHRARTQIAHFFARERALRQVIPHHDLQASMASELRTL